MSSDDSLGTKYTVTISPIASGTVVARVTGDDGLQITQYGFQTMSAAFDWGEEKRKQLEFVDRLAEGPDADVV